MRAMREGLTIAGLAATVSLFFTDIVRAGLNLFARDITRVYYPERRVIATILSRGDFPFWNPFYNAGQPLAANPGYHVFYPPQWLLSLGDFRDAFHLEIVLHYPLAAVGMYLLVRSFDTRVLPALFAGFSYALGSWALALGSFLPFCFSIAWLPWVMLFFRRYTISGRISNLTLSAIAFGLIVLIADVSMILQTCGILALFAIHAAQEGRDRFRPLIAASAIIALGALAGAVQIVPALDFQADSGRAFPIPYATAMRWSLPPLRLLELIWPTLYGTGSGEVFFYWGGSALYGQQLPWILSIYPGLLVMTLAIAGFVGGVRARALAGSIIIVSIVLALGAYGGVFPVVYRLGFQSLRYPEKFIISALFALCMFAGIVANEGLVDARLRKVTSAIASIVALFSAALAAVSLVPAAMQMFSRIGLFAYLNPLYVERFRQWMIVTLGIAAIVAILLRFEGMSARLRVALIVATVIVDLGVRVQSYMPRLTADFYTEPPAAQALRESGGRVRVYNYADWYMANTPETPLPAGLRPWIIRNALLPSMEMSWGFEGVADQDVTETNLLPTIRFKRILETVLQSRRMDRMPLLMQMAGASHVAEPRTLDPQVIFDPRRFDEIVPATFVRTRNAGRYYLAEEVVTARNEMDVAAALLSNVPLPPRTVFANIRSFRPAPGRVLAARETSNSIELVADTAGRALLVLAITPHKYWRATVNGTPARLIEANVGFQALVLERGHHQIALRYRNPRVVIWGVISTFTMMSLIACSVAGLFPGFRSRAAAVG